MERVLIQWTDTAKTGLGKLPRRVRRGLLDKAGELRDADDLSACCKELTGPLSGYYQFSFEHFRAVYSIERENLASGDVLCHIIIRFIAAGTRSEGSKQEIYKIAEKLLSFIEPGILLDSRPPMKPEK